MQLENVDTKKPESDLPPTLNAAEILSGENASEREKQMAKRIIQLEREKLEALLQSRIDGLTDLHNRIDFDERFEAEFTASRRHEKALSLLFLDIDHFKNLNDNYGHQAGDEALRQVAKTLKEVCRTEDVPCRYGGEEFTIILPDTGKAGAEQLAERLRAAIEEKEINFEGQKLPVTASIGISTFSHQEKGEALIQEADKALYQAKTGGRNKVVSYKNEEEGPNTEGGGAPITLESSGLTEKMQKIAQSKQVQKELTDIEATFREEPAEIAKFIEQLLPKDPEKRKAVLAELTKAA